MNERKIALVTGANRGIGLETCRQLRAAGFHVVLTARDKMKGEKAAAETEAEFFPLDVRDESSILRLGMHLKEKYDHLDVLVNNAGILKKEDRNILSAGHALVEETFSTNGLGPLFLTQALVPLMSAGSRIIMVSSGGGIMTDPVGGWSPVYCISKSLLNAVTRHLAYALNGKGIFVNAVCPGWVRTDMGGKGATRSVSKGAETITWLATEKEIPTGKFFRDKREIPF